MHGKFQFVDVKTKQRAKYYVLVSRSGEERENMHELFKISYLG